ncbi:DUF1173 family protein [Streptomyces stelliscabiei]|uniref:DUF1173 family protein n=1 Tax=Streptomyces stelliscabiei TaxID=146820 RepID=UPI0029AB4DC2|nr:DUF1173 family protein [Streptomyces stelliscabiei]MDX3435644.1 DUF1173 family protein [Streptomyces stelliscabiei]MDX3622057.1 DUF1173 family protein [Streptomyces stelliscabiei]
MTTPSQADRADRVRLADKSLPLIVLREHATDYAPLFARARAEVGHGQCLCQTPALRLVIRCSRAGRYHLAGWPGEGELHDPSCSFHKLASELTGRDGYSTEAIHESDDGVAIRFSAALARKLSAPEPATTSTEQREGCARRTVGLLGLLHWLWEESQLNAWHPRWRRRTWWVCHALLSEQIAGCSINHEELTETLYVVPPFREQYARRNTAAFETFRIARLKRRGDTQRRGLILGEIRDVKPTRYGIRYALAHHRGALFATTALDERLRRSYRPAFSSAADEHGARRIGLFLVELSPKGHVRVVDMAAMLVSKVYTPADSSHEVVMANALTDAGRAYVKPVRYDGSDLVFPDFVLTDTHPHSYVEVYGIHGRESYDQRKRVKQAHYQSQGAALVEWDVAHSIPDVRRR